MKNLIFKIEEGDSFSYRDEDYIRTSTGDIACDEDGHAITKEGAIAFKVFFWVISYKFEFEGRQYGQFIKTESDKEKFELKQSLMLDSIKVLMDAAYLVYDDLLNKRNL